MATTQTKAQEIVNTEHDRTLARYRVMLAGDKVKIERYLITTRKMRAAGDIDPAWADECLKLAEDLRAELPA